MSRTRITAHQMEVLQGLHDAPAAEPLDFDQLLDKLSWGPTKESAQFTVRALITRGLMEKTALTLRRGRNRVCYRLTAAGALVFDPRGPAPVAAVPAPAPAGEVVPAKPALPIRGDELEHLEVDSVPGLDEESVEGEFEFPSGD